MERLPPALLRRGGVIMPMWQAEAMWINFGGHRREYPFAVKIATGKVNAISGKEWSSGLNRDPQDYVVTSKQPWLDGYCVEKGTIRQFVAAPIGKGITVEEQITGKGEHGGLQIVAHPMKREAYERLIADRDARIPFLEAAYLSCRAHAAPCRVDLGLAAGGKMRQEIYEDPYDPDVWDLDASSRCFVTILDARAWMEVTGEPPPTRPVTAEQYKQAGIPWFDYYAADQKALEGSPVLAEVESFEEASFSFLDAAEADFGETEALKVKHVGPGRRPKSPRSIREWLEDSGSDQGA